MIDILYMDEKIIVCIKPAGVLSTDEPGGLPGLLREQLGIETVRTVHRLDRVVSGVMVVARNAKSASELSRQVRENEFEKEYLAVVHGVPAESGTLRDLLGRDKARKMTFVADSPAKGVQEAVLDYVRLNTDGEYSRVKVRLHTGRTHQIRVQYASRGFPLVGERKYSELNDPCEIALFSHKIAFTHPGTGERMQFSAYPSSGFPWTQV